MRLILNTTIEENSLQTTDFFLQNGENLFVKNIGYSGALEISIDNNPFEQVATMKKIILAAGQHNLILKNTSLLDSCSIEIRAISH